MTVPTATHSLDGKSVLKKGWSESCSLKKFVILGAGFILCYMLLMWTRKSPAIKATTNAPLNVWGLPSNKDNEFVKIVYWVNIPAEEKREREWSRRQHPQSVICNHDQIKCMFSSDRSLAPYSDALLIHVSKTEHYPTTRPRHQKWGFYEGSSPPLKKGEYPAEFYHHKDHFNFISTYSQHQSHIPAPMIPWVNCEQSSNITEKPSNFSVGKSHQVAWLATRCETGSAREEYISELSKHIHVDIIGKCDANHCPRGQEDCIHKMLNYKYKFLIVFEDEICLDYVTTPIAMAYTVNVIPVVMGAANYNKLLPKGSFINAKDFEAPDDLATYLKIVSRDPALYNQIVAARFRSACVRNAPYLCRLCSYLHNTKEVVNRTLDIEQYWNYDSLCTDNEEFYSF